MKTKIKNLLEVMFYLMAAIGLIDMIGQAMTKGELRIIREVLAFLFTT